MGSYPTLPAVKLPRYEGGSARARWSILVRLFPHENRKGGRKPRGDGMAEVIEKIKPVTEEIETFDLADFEYKVRTRPLDFEVYGLKSDPVVVDKETGAIYHY